MTNLNDFLRSTKSRVLEEAGKESSSVVVYAVMGNEAADLDSMSSAITTSLLRSLDDVHGEGEENATVLYVPVINIPAEDFVLRGECVYLFQKVLSIDVANLVFWDQVNFSSLRDAGRLRFVLVDHNHLTTTQESFGNLVVEIIDHHVDEKLYTATSNNRRKIETIGSCSTLVTEEILASKHCKEVLTVEVAKLLAATILVDTVNFNPTAKKGTPKDRTLLDVLLNDYLKDSGINPDEFFAELQKRKLSVEHLTPSELIRRDYKEIEVVTPREGHLKVGISSFPLSAALWVSQSSDRFADLAVFSQKRDLAALLIMGAFSDPAKHDSFARDLLLHCDNNQRFLFEDISKFLRTNDELKLKIVNTNASSDHGYCIEYQQGNVAASRKQLLPLVNSFLTNW